MKRNSINHKDSNWKYTLPKVDAPFLGESLFGYILRLDYINNLPPGSIIKSVLTVEQLTLFIKKYDMECLENAIDISKLLELTGLLFEDIDRLTISNLRRRLYGSDDIYAKKSLKYSIIKICPICIENWKIPQIHLFWGVDACLIHGLKLISHCECKAKIEFFNKPVPLICKSKNCKKNYMNLFCEYEDLKQQSYIQSILNSYILYDTPLCLPTSNFREVLNKKINFLIEIQDLAKRYITSNVVNAVYPIDFSYSDKEHYQSKFNIVKFSNFLFYYGLSPYQFLMLDISKDKINNIYLSEIGIKSNTQMKQGPHFSCDNGGSFLLKHLDNSIADTYKTTTMVYGNKFRNYKTFINMLLTQNKYFELAGKVNIDTTKFTVALNFIVKKQHENGLVLVLYL